MKEKTLDFVSDTSLFFSVTSDSCSNISNPPNQSDHTMPSGVSVRPGVYTDLWHWGSTVTQSFEKAEFSCSSWRQHCLGKVPMFYFHFNISSQSETELLMSRVLPGETVCSSTPAEGKRAKTPPAVHHRCYHLRGFMRRPLTPEQSITVFTAAASYHLKTSPCFLHLCLILVSQVFVCET